MYDEKQEEEKQKKNPLAASREALNMGKNVNQFGKNLSNIKKGASDFVGKEATKEAAKEVAKKSFNSTLVGTGVGAPVAIGERVISLGKKTLNNLSNSKNQKSSGGSFLIVFIVIISLCIIFPVSVIMCGIHGLIGASIEKYHEDQYNYFSWENGFFASFKQLFPKFLIGEDENADGYDPYRPLEDGLEKNVNILKKAFDTAYLIAQDELIGIINQRDYDYTLTLESFIANEYPFSDINFAEIISIVSQKDTYNIENITFKDFKALFKANKNNKNLRYLYCMEVVDAYKEIHYYYDEKQIRVDISNLNDAPEGETVYTEEKKYGLVKLKHYDLKSLYEMLELEPNEKNKHWNVNNIDMLNEQEKYMRYFGRDFDLGPETRTVWDWGFDRVYSFASEEDYQKYMEYIKDLFPVGADHGEKLKELSEIAFSTLGATYSMDKRFEKGYFDCSSLTYWIYQQIGVDIGGYGTTASTECRYLEETGYKISDSYNEAIMRPGDLIFYSTEPSGKYKNITHTAIYIGDGKMIDASYSLGKVVYRNVWGKKDIVSVCRPLQ